MRLFRLSILAVLTGFFMTAHAEAGDKNIFDEDWTPPKATPKPAVATRPAAPAPPVAQLPVVPPAVVTPAPVAPAAGRLSTPAATDQAAVRKVMKEVFAKLLADRTPAGRRKLAAALFDQAEKSAAYPAERYVVLAAAYEASVDGGDLAMASRAADELARAFKVDGSSMKAAAVTAYGPRPTPPGLAREIATANVYAAIDIAALLAAADDFPAAVRACQAVVQTAIVADAPARALLQVRLRDYTQRRDADARIAGDVQRLIANPDDRAANLAVGKYYCLIRNDPAMGLPMLAKGSDPALKALAANELAGPKTAEALAALADEWWAFATNQNDAQMKSCAMIHAADLYDRARTAGLSGLRRTLADRRIAEVQAAAKSAVGGEAPSRTTHTVAADKIWQQAIDVKAGDVLTFTASGQVGTHADKPMTGPNGQRINGRPFGCLLGQIGAFPIREVFIVGADGRHVAGIDGPLSFRIDDNPDERALSDNRGQFQVTVTRTPAVKPPSINVGEPEQFIIPATDVVCRALRAGEYEVTAKGEWSHVPSGPLREPGWKGDEDNLIAKLTDDKFTPIGKGARLSVPNDMIVRFKIRDDDSGMTDNRGQITVSIRLIR
jgi:hypothetical protein